MASYRIDAHINKHKGAWKGVLSCTEKSSSTMKMANIEGRIKLIKEQYLDKEFPIFEFLNGFSIDKLCTIILKNISKLVYGIL